MKSQAGTPYFMAPEVLNENYKGGTCDIWSLGCVLYMLVTGERPFDGTSRSEVNELILNADYPEIHGCSKDVVDLIKHMLVVNVKKRYTASDCLKHAWFKKNAKGTITEDMACSQNVVNNLRKFKGQSHLRKAAMNILVKMINPLELEDLHTQFRTIDKDKSGIIDVAELRDGIKKANFSDITDEELNSIIGQLDYDNNGKINYSEFIAATVNLGSLLTDDKINALFKQFDVDNTDKITYNNIKDAFTKLGQELSDGDIRAILSMHDDDGDSSISLEEFRKMLLDK